MRYDLTGAPFDDRGQQSQLRRVARPRAIARTLARPANATPTGNIIVTLGMIAGLLLAWAIVVIR